MKQALVALEYHTVQTRPLTRTQEAMTSLRAAIAAAQPAPGRDPLAAIYLGDDGPEWNDEFEVWWEAHGQYCRAGGGDYEKTFAFRAWEAAVKTTPPAQPAPAQEPAWVDAAIRGDMARAVFDAVRIAVPGLGPWSAFDADDVQRMVDALKPFTTPPPAQPAPVQQPVAWRAWFDADSGARWLFTLWPEEERLDVKWDPLYTTPPAQPAPVQEPTLPELSDPEDCRAWCPRCDGTRDEVQMSDSSPDAHEVTVNCRHCDGAGTLYAAYTGVVRELAKQHEAYSKACGEIYFSKLAVVAPTEATHTQLASEPVAQALRIAAPATKGDKY
jgi:hypothetical protein